MAKKKVYVLKRNDGDTMRFATKTVGAGFFKLEVGVPIEVTITSPIFKGQKFGKSKIDGLPDIVNVTRLADGIEGKLLVRRVLHNRLTEGYPNEGYVNRNFRITVQPPPEGERFFLYDVEELIPLAPGEEPEGEEPEGETKSKSKKK